MEHWLGWSRRAGLRGGCPVAAALFELDDIESEVRSHAAKLEQHWRGLLRRIVTEAKSLRHLSDETDIEQFIWELWAIYLSHHVSSRFLREADANIRARIAFDALVDRHRPSPTRPAAEA
jgi:hypothetical protein